MTDTIVVSFDEFRRITGRRFRLTPEESGRVKSGEATREQILQERFDAGLEPKQKTEDFWNDPRLTLDNFKEIAGRRFRRNRDQAVRGLSRAEAFAETLAEKKNV